MNKRKILGGMLLVCLMLGMIPISSGVGKSDFLIKVPDELPNGATITDITGYKEIKDEIEDYYPHAIDAMAYDYSDNSVICILVFSSVTDTQKDFKHSFSTFSELEGGMQFEDFVVYHSEFKQLFDSSSTWIKKNAWIGGFDGVTFTLDNYVIFIDPLSILEGLKIAEMVYSLNQEILTSTAQALKYAPTPQELPEVFYYTSIETGSPQLLDDLQKECEVRPIYGEVVEGLSKTEEPADLGMFIVEFSNIEDAKKCYLHFMTELSDGYITEIDAFGDESFGGYGPAYSSGHIVGISDDFVTVFRNDRFIASIMTNDMDELNNSKIVVTDILPKMIDEKLEQVKATMPTADAILLENPRFESGELDPWYYTKYYDPYDKCDWINIGVDSEARYEGDYGAYIDIRCSLDAWGRIIQEPIEITPGEKLAVEAKLMYKGDLNSGYAELWLVFLDADKKSLDHVYKKYYESDFGAEGKWLSAVLPATTAPSNAKYVRIMVGLADVKSCRLNIDDVILKSGSATENHPPTATKIEPTSDSITIEPGDTQEFKVKAEDVDEEEHNNLHMIQWFVDDVWVETASADGTSAEASFSYTFENAGTFSVKATAYDEQMEVDSVTWDVDVGIAPKIIGFTQVPSNPVGTGEVYYVITYKNDEQDEGFVTLDIQEGNKVVKEPIEYIKGHGQLSDTSKAAVKGNMAAIFEKVLDKMADEGLLDFFDDYLGQDLDSFLDVEDAIGFKIFSQVYSNDDYGKDYDIKVTVEDEVGKDSKAVTTSVREYYIGIIEEEIEDTNNNPEDGRQIEGIINIPFNYCLPSHDAYIIFVGGEKIIEAYTGKVKSPNAKVMLPKFHLSDGTPRLKHLVKKGKENIKLTTHLVKKPQETKTKIEIVLVDDEGTEYSDDVTLDFQNNYYVNPNWEGRFTEYRRGNEIFKADLTKSQFEEEFKDTNVLKLTKEVEENLNNNKYYDGAYIPDEQRGYANNLMSFEAAELEFVGKNEIEDVKWINDIWEIYGWFGHIKTGVEILVQGADFVTNFNPTKFLLKTLAEEGIGLVISAATDVWKDALAGDGENIITLYDDAPSGDLEGNKYGVFTHVHAKQSKYEDDGELKEIINAKKIIWRFTQPFFLCESGKWEFVATGTGAGGIVDADYIPGGANCIEWRSKPEFISPKEKNTISFAGEIKRGVFPDFENQRDLFFVIELPDAYEILYDKKGTGFKLSEFTGVETPIELPIEDNLNDKNEEIETEYPKLYDRAGDSIFRIYVKETEDKWCVKNDGVETDYYDFNPDTVHPRLFAVNLEKSLGKPYYFGFTLTVDKDLKADKYDDYVIKYGVFPGKVSSTSEDDVIYAKNYKSMTSYDINSANGLNLRDSFSLKVTDAVSVSGQVIDKESGEPISNAVVGVYHGIGQILDPYTYTDSDGKFNLSYLGEEPFTLAAWKEGYIREEKEVNRGACTFYLISQDPGETFTNTIGMEFVLIPAGEFEMGSDEGYYFYYGPAHHVTIVNPFYMGKYEVTQEQWRAIMGDNPSYFTGDDDLPVECVSWDDVQDFITKLNEKEGTDKYRLPSEAEWEYACRAGTTTRHSFDDDESELYDYAWYYLNSGWQTHPVGQKKPNSWGLYDMYGNVHEWVQDCWHSDYNGAPTDGSAWEVACYHGAVRVYRGGSWGGCARLCQSAYRDQDDPRGRSDSLGFRLLQEV